MQTNSDNNRSYPHPDYMGRISRLQGILPIRRIINLRVKSTGMFWKREHAENVIFLRSLVLTGKLRDACRTACNVMKNKYCYSSEGDFNMVVS